MKNLIAYMLLSALAEKMVPGKSYRRYISLAAGLIMIMLMVSPLISIFGDDSGLIEKIEEYMNVSEDDVYDLEDVTGARDEAENFLADKPDYETVGSEELVKSTLKSMGTELESLDVTKDKDGEIMKITAVVTIISEVISTDDEEYRLLESVKEYISEIYNLDGDSIYVVKR